MTAPGRRRRPAADELKARKSILVGGYGRDLATTGGLADILGNLALYGVPLDEITRYTGKVEAVTRRRGAGLRRPHARPGQAPA